MKKDNCGFRIIGVAFYRYLRKPCTNYRKTARQGVSVKVPHKTDAGVDRYWHVTQILCLGPSSGGYKFRIYGKAAKSSSSHTINMMYLLPNNRVQIAGAYIFPAITEGKSFKFDIVSAFKGLCTILVQRFLYP